MLGQLRRMDVQTMAVQALKRASYLPMPLVATSGEDLLIQDLAEERVCEVEVAWAHLRMGDLDDAREAFEMQAENGFAPGIASYNIACCYAVENDAEAAMLWLTKAMDDGAVSIDHIRTDPDLDALRDDAGFQAFLEERAYMAHEEKEGDSKEHSEKYDKKDQGDWDKKDTKGKKNYDMKDKGDGA